MRGMQLEKQRWPPMLSSIPTLPEIVDLIGDQLDPERSDQPDLEVLQRLMGELDGSLVSAVQESQLGLDEIRALLTTIDSWRNELAILKSDSRRALKRGARRQLVNRAYLGA